MTAAALTIALLVAACASSGGPGPRFAGIGSIFNTDLSAKNPRRTQSENSGNVVTLGRGEEVYYGSGRSVAARDGEGQTASTFEPGEFNLNFQNADVREVVQSILGNALNENYTIDPGVGGTVTLSSARPLSRDDLLPTLEVVLQTVGAALVRSDGIYRITPEATAVASTTDYGGALPGYGLTIIPLEHISAGNLIRLIEGFGVRPGAVRADAQRNLLVVQGSSAERQAAIETALNFDVDWMANQAVAILPLKHAKPTTIIPELERVFGTRNGSAGSNLIQFMPMQRLRAVLAVSPRRQLIERARTWVSRLDTENPDLEANVYVYRVKYRDAERLASLLNKIFSSGSGGFTPETPRDQVEPGGDEITFEGFTQGGDQGFQQGGGPDLIAGGGGGDSAFAETGPQIPIGGEDQGTDQQDATKVASGSARIQADTANNSLVIYADLETRQQILAALNRIDVPQLQVAINVTMAEIRLNDELRYGVQYFVRSQSVGAGNNKGSFGLFDTLANNISRELPGFNFVLGSEAAPEVIISAFQSVTDVQVLSSPSLVVVENETAKFQVGDQIPIVTRTVQAVQDPEAPVSNEIEYRDTGIILRIKPRIAENGVVNLDIVQEISTVTENANTLTPTISNRAVDSTISVVDGQTVLLGGLIGEQTAGGRRGIPGLSQIPGIGGIFGHQQKTGRRTELIILIRPQVIRGSEDAQHVAEELRDRMWRARLAD